MSGRITHLQLAQASGTPMRRVPTATALAERGFEHDRHTKRKRGGKRQLLLVDAENLRGLQLAPGALKENVVVEGLPLESLPVGQRLRLGAAVVVELTGPCVPCHKLEKLRPGLLSESWGRRGQLAKVLKGGAVKEGDEVVLLDINPHAEKPIQPKLP